MHSGHAPNGLLKENERGSISSTVCSCPLGQESFSENERYRGLPSASRPPNSAVFFLPFSATGSTSTNSATTRPSASFRAVSTESVRRWRMPSFMARRSTTTAMVCLTCFFSTGGSESWTVSPSTTARAKPCVDRSLNRSTNSPLRPRTTGASTWKRVRSGSSSSWSTICCGVCRLTGSPHCGQCGTPTRAQSRRM